MTFRQRGLSYSEGMKNLPEKGPRRIVITGGPGGGKTTIANQIRLNSQKKIVIVPEVATMLFSGGFPRFSDELARRAAQTAIYHVQKNLEEVYLSQYSDRVILCDRGTLDGAAYWPEEADLDFFQTLQTTVKDEVDRYDAVVFFETAAVGQISIDDGNGSRNETLDEAVDLDRRLQSIWRQHHNFHFIACEKSFDGKRQSGMLKLDQVLQAGF